MTDPELTKQARQNMFHALREYRDAKLKVQSLTQYPSFLRDAQLPAVIRAIDQATEYILIARDLDPSVTIGQQNNEITINDVITRILLLEAIIYGYAEKAQDLGYEWQVAHAVDVLKKYLTYQPDNLSAVIFYIRLLVRLNQNKLARSILDDLLAEHPEHQEAWVVLEDFKTLELHERIWPKQPNKPYESFLYYEWMLAYPIGKLP